MEGAAVLPPKLVPNSDPVEAVVVAPKPLKLGVIVEPKAFPAVLPAWLDPKPNAVAVDEGVPNENPPPVEAWLEAPNRDMIYKTFPFERFNDRQRFHKEEEFNQAFYAAWARKRSVYQQFNRSLRTETITDYLFSQLVFRLNPSLCFWLVVHAVSNKEGFPD